MNLPRLTPTRLRAWARANRDLAHSVAVAQTFAIAERARVDAYTRPIFVSFGFVDEDDGTPLTDPERSYLAGGSPEVEARMTEYYAACRAAHVAHGWTGDPEYCPALVAESDARDAESALLDSLGVLVGCEGSDFSRTLELRAKTIAWALVACLGAIQ